MWRELLIVWLTVISCVTIPKGSPKDLLHRLVRLPKTDFPAPLVFDRVDGFVVFPNESAALAEAAELLKEAKGRPADAPSFLAAGRTLARADMASAIRSYARAVELFERAAELETGNASALIGLSDACLALGRFGEAQAALDKAEGIDPERTQRARARFHKEKAWSLFAGEENRFTTAAMVDIIQRAMAANRNMRMEAARQELELAVAAYRRTSPGITNDVSFLEERAQFASFEAVLQNAFSELQGADKSRRGLLRSLFPREALEDLGRVAELQPSEPRAIAVAAFTRAYAENIDVSLSDAELSEESRKYVLNSCRRLELIAESGSKKSAEAAELLADARIFLLRDNAGGERSARAALRVESSREGAWDLLALSLLSKGRNAELVESSEDRVAALPNARSSALLVKAYALGGDKTQAEWNGLLAAGLYPTDLDVNLTLAALLLARESYTEVLSRAGDALNRAEKQMTNAPRQKRLDFALLKSIYLALLDQTSQARALLDPFARAPDAIELQEVLRALD